MVIHGISKTGGLRNHKHVTVILRRKILETIIFVIRSYPMISSAHQMCLHIIDQLKDLLDDKDMTLMRRFIRDQFDRESKFKYASGTETAGFDRAELTKITILIKAAT